MVSCSTHEFSSDCTWGWMSGLLMPCLKYICIYELAETDVFSGWLLKCLVYHQGLQWLNCQWVLLLNPGD